MCPKMSKCVQLGVQKSAKRVQIVGLLKPIIMAKLALVLDTRSGNGTFPLKVRISTKKTKSYIGLNIRLSPEQWNDENSKIVNHDDEKSLNLFVENKMTIFKSILLKLDLARQTDNYSANELRDIIERGGVIENEDDSEGFLTYYKYCITRKFKDSTKTSYQQTLNNLLKFDPLLQEKKFEDITLRYLEDFDKWMTEKGITQNSKNVYYRNIRSVFNDAIDEDITTNYPFRKFKLKKVTTRKRSLSVEELRTLRDYPCEEWQEKYRDIFMLMFYLCGINGADLYPAKKSQVRKGRLEYERAKTYKAYSIKIEPEAQAIIDKYAGDEYLLKFCEGDKNYTYILQRMSRALKEIGPYSRKGLGGKKEHKPLFPELTQYWCRHTWATIAAELDIPKETIAAALGHDMGNTTTAIYINFNQKKVDDANRRVIDYLNKK